MLQDLNACQVSSKHAHCQTSGAGNGFSLQAVAEKTPSQIHAAWQPCNSKVTTPSNHRHDLTQVVTLPSPQYSRCFENTRHCHTGAAPTPPGFAIPAVWVSRSTPELFPRCFTACKHVQSTDGRTRTSASSASHVHERSSVQLPLAILAQCT